MKHVWPRLAEHARAVLALAPLLFFIFFVQFLAHTDPDYWWQVLAGQHLADTRTLPGADAYSFTAPGRVSVSHEWLTQLVFYGVSRQFGYVGNVVLFGLASALTWLAVYATCRLRGLGELGAVLLMMGAFAIAWASLAVRPQVLTMLFLATYVWLLTRYRCGERRALWALPPLMVVWVNLHGGYVVGLALLGLTILGEAIARWWRLPTAPPRPLLVVTALTAGATLLNPHGADALLFPLSLAGTQNTSMLYITEWQSPDFHHPYFLLFAAALLLTMLLGLAARPLGPTDVLWGLVFTLMPLRSVRHLALYAIVVVPLVGARLQEILPPLRRTLATWQRPAVLLLLWPPLLGCCVLLALRAGEQGTPLQTGREPSAAGYPAAAAVYLQEQAGPGNLFNEYDWGGFLIYRLYPGRRVFIDGRLDLYSPDVVDAYMAAQTLRPDWRQVLDRYDVGLALLRPANPLAVALHDLAGWERIYADDVAEIYRRQP